jgi:hypothetical protein
MNGCAEYGWILCVGKNIYITIWMCRIWMNIMCKEEHIHTIWMCWILCVGKNIYITIWMCGIWMDIMCREEHIHNNMDVWNMDGYYV